MTDQLIHLLADGLVVPIVLVAGYFLLVKVPLSKRFEVYVRILMAGVTAYLIAKLLASVYQPAGERPFEAMGVDPGASYLNNPGFPSDHALFTGFLTLAVWYATKNKWATGVLAVLTILTCIGRVLALVHTPLDVIGGLAVAAIGALWYFLPVQPGTKSKKVV